jgi:putative tricarboxylic transport membrane protein
MKSGIQERKAEVANALFFIVIGVLAIIDSLRTGFRWSTDGPQPGYFPFYIGLFMIAAASVQIYRTVKTWQQSKDIEFVSHEQFALVLRMFMPSLLFVVGVMTVGIYVSALLYIAAFMVWQGKFSVLKSALVAVCVTAVLFAIFELWFHVALPKGPIEALFGF